MKCDSQRESQKGGQGKILNLHQGQLQSRRTSKKIKVLSIFGTRPEAIKMVPPIKALSAHNSVESLVCVTAQHRELLDGVVAPFNIKPDYDLDLMRDRQSLTEFTARALTGLEDVIKSARPDWILVHGDTATTLAASLAAFYNKVNVGHVEAGLRSYDKYRPFPEEINRKVTSAIADLHFAPTELAKQQLLRENVAESSIVVTGNTAIDLMVHTVKKGHAFKSPDIADILLKNRFGLSGSNPGNRSKQNQPPRIILMTAHRRENWGEPLENIFRAVRRVADDFTDILIIYPVHPNPVVQEQAAGLLSGHDRIVLTEPIDIFDMHNLMAKAHLVLTDSGGLQEEAPSLNVPVIVLREVTERPEGEQAGTLILAGTEEEKVYNTVRMLLTDEGMHSQMAKAPNPFGDGKASGRIVEAIIANTLL